MPVLNLTDNDLDLVLACIQWTDEKFEVDEPLPEAKEQVHKALQALTAKIKAQEEARIQDQRNWRNLLEERRTMNQEGVD